MIAVIVEFEASPGKADELRDALQTQGRSSLEKEPGCRYFDVCQDPENEHVFFLYELYDDADAVEAHGKTEHYAAFRATIDPLLKSRVRREMARL
ncbi:MAG: antibiotic biosynthesis monooxygenase [Hyphomicrobiaceae bacterium]|nr:antibiotic biosynthesis monooxygenase [Hyphomicrobiaceae bacterium]